MDSPNLYVPYQKAAVIPDVHQDTDFVFAVYDFIEKDGTFDGVIFLGDYFDYHKSQGPRAGVKATVGAILRDCPLPATYLLGNHDAQYLWTNRQRQIKAKQAFEIPVGCSGYSKSRAVDVKRYWPEMGNRVQPFALCQGVLLSHAGINSRLILPIYEDQEALEKLYLAMTADVKNVSVDHPLFWIPRSRGGHHPFGGPLWQDWHEFEDDLPWPQVVGHTANKRIPSMIGRSLCLDHGQTTWATLEGGDLHIHKV